ncbi:MAG: uncharacterized protein family UPF0547 [Bacteriophage sp.]|nr:MAG: uncharacterized protein family UPF0547 [Bacteriophage sp.]
MIHIKETEIIPLLKNAKAEYSQKITEGDPKDAEMAERIEEAPVIKRGMDFYCCPACEKRTSRNHTHCHWCGKKLGWSR